MSEIERNNKADQPKMRPGKALMEVLASVIDTHIQDWREQRALVWSVNQSTVFADKHDPQTDAAYAHSTIG